MTYPHRQRAPGQIDCRCGAYASTDADLRAGTWGADCPAAMRERIGELEAERDGARTESDKRNVQLTAARERIADLERQLTAATAVVHLTTGARP